MEQEKPTKPETDRTFPEDDDTLYREMTVHMPRCYFPTSLGENSILKFAGEEFRRVKNIVCRRSKVTHIMKTSIRSFPLFHVRSSSSTWSKLPKNTVQLRLLTDAPAKATIRFVLKSAFTL